MAAINQTQDGSNQVTAQGQASQPQTSPTTATTNSSTSQAAGQPSWVNDPQFAGMSPALQQVYLSTGMTPAGQGTGFADWQYWQNTAGPSQYARLTNDIQGTGTDQPTGTPGQGAWDNSGGGGSSGSLISSVVSGMPPFDINAVAGQVSGIPSNPYTQTPQDQTLYGQLQGMINQSQVVDPNDPVIKSQVDAAQATQDREAKNLISSSAEQGGPFGSTDAVARSAYEQAGQNTAALQSQLMQNELTARRAQIQNALSESGSLLTAQDQMSLQKQLGLITAALQGQGLANQYSLGQQQINSSNDQFAANYGLNAGNQSNYWNWLYSGGGA